MAIAVYGFMFIVFLNGESFFDTREIIIIPCSKNGTRKQLCL